MNDGDGSDADSHGSGDGGVGRNEGGVNSGTVDRQQPVSSF